MSCSNVQVNFVTLSILSKMKCIHDLNVIRKQNILCVWTSYLYLYVRKLLSTICVSVLKPS